jgi:hypothetical protein
MTPIEVAKAASNRQAEVNKEVEAAFANLQLKNGTYKLGSVNTSGGMNLVVYTITKENSLALAREIFRVHGLTIIEDGKAYLRSSGVGCPTCGGGVEE